ncbi:MAG: hypothetical protein NC114_09840 [Ruminococcus flavefaciens]|nr:hypothetical protein [Ruminococcus flavefaciens]
MNQLVLNIEDPKILPSLRKILASIKGVSIERQTLRRTGLDDAINDAKEGRINRYESVDALFNKFGL